MKKFISALLTLLVAFSTSAAKFNQRGEKIVSEIRIDYADGSAFPYVIKLGYDSMSEVSSLVLERQSLAHEIVRMDRNKGGDITREDFANNKKISLYEIKVDSEKRPVEMVRYDIEKKKTLKIGTFYYVYDFQDYALSIVHQDASDNFAASRESVKFIDNNAYVLYNIINLTNGNESKTQRRDRKVSYTDYDNDLNVDISQIVRGVCNVGGRLLNLEVDSNLLMLVQWVPVKSRKMLSTMWAEKMIYNYDGEVLKSIDVIYPLTNKLHYTISLSYLD